MSARAWWRLLGWVLVLALPVLLGCGQRPPRLVLVQGKLLYQGRPVAGARIKFVPDAAQEGAGFAAHGTTDHDGAFTLQTYPHGPGAVPGTYRVTVKSGMCCEGDRPVALPEKYADLFRTPLEVRVTDAGLEQPTLRLAP